MAEQHKVIVDKGFNDANNKRVRIDSEEFVLRKRLPQWMPRRHNDVYVNMKTRFDVQIKKCVRIIEESTFDQLFIHGIGAAVNRAINMSLQLASSHSLNIDINTSSIEMQDDVEPIGPNREDTQSFTQQRTVSAVHIRLFHNKP